MFNNSGGEIKLLSKIFTFLNIGVCLIIGIYLLGEDKNDIERFAGLLLTIVGPFQLYFIGLLLYGFGVIVTNNDDFMRNGFPVNNVQEEKETDDIIRKMKKKGYLDESETEHITENK